LAADESRKLIAGSAGELIADANRRIAGRQKPEMQYPTDVGGWSRWHRCRLKTDASWKSIDSTAGGPNRRRKSEVDWKAEPEEQQPAQAGG
jgi:hypothetical protein